MLLLTNQSDSNETFCNKSLCNPAKGQYNKHSHYATPTPSLPACGGLSSSSGAPAHSAHKARRGCHHERLIPSPTPHHQRPTAASYWASAEVQVLTARAHGPPYQPPTVPWAMKTAWPPSPSWYNRNCTYRMESNLDPLAYPTRGKGWTSLSEVPCQGIGALLKWTCHHHKWQSPREGCWMFILCVYAGGGALKKMKWKSQEVIRPRGLYTILTKGDKLHRNGKTKEKVWAFRGSTFEKVNVWEKPMENKGYSARFVCVDASHCGLHLLW